MDRYRPATALTNMAYPHVSLGPGILAQLWNQSRQHHLKGSGVPALARSLSSVQYLRRTVPLGAHGLIPVDPTRPNLASNHTLFGPTVPYCYLGQ